MNAKCQHPGCTGQIVDGYCDECGKPPSRSGSVALTPPASSASGSMGSSRVGSSPSGTASSGTGSSGTGSSGTGSSGSGRSSSSRTNRRGSHGSSARALGAGMVMLPELPSQDPLLLIMSEPVVPDKKRYCAKCNAKVNREKGFCPNCGAEYNFTPTLKAGDVLVAQYEIKGPIAYGGLGWIYLGWDRALSRWIVLKGLLNSKDEASAAAALAERQFLAAVKHPKIVGVYNFVTQGSEGYIVMEYVGGKTLKTLRQEQGSLPPEVAISYIHGILPAFGYLHAQGLVYCDFKPDNCMLEGDDVKLIDMGGVRRLDDLGGDIYGTKGYSAPEASHDPSVSSDLFTVARTLAVLMFDFAFQGAYQFSLPPASDVPVLAENDSLRRWLQKAMRKDPEARFVSAGEMADQLLGVLREVVSKRGVPKITESQHFFADPIHAEEADAAPDLKRLPMLKLDPLDPAASALLSAQGLSDALLPPVIEGIAKQFPDSMEARLRLADLHLNAERWAEAQLALKEARQLDPLDWRVLWHEARYALLTGPPKQAAALFDSVMDEVPGEIAPRLAAAIAFECAEELSRAAELYLRVLRVEPSLVSASFGLARCKLKEGRRADAADALRRVPPASSLYNRAQVALTKVLLESSAGPPTQSDLVNAGQALQALTIEGYNMHLLASRVFLGALEALEKNGVKPDPSLHVLGKPFEESGLRAGAERELRAAARYASTREEQVALVDRANSVRPWTLL